MSFLKVGQPAPAFSLQGTDGKTYRLNQHGVGLTLAVFFKTDCPTCMMAFPYFERIHQAYHLAGLQVWGISQHDRARTIEFAENYPSTFPTLLDTDWRVSKLYDHDNVPTSMLIGPDGKIVDSVISFDKAGLNRLSQGIATQLGVAAATIAQDNDGNPPFRPG
jgi:cytochrome c biogenesis protein CcmG, thiol:disulfide interchange protein DsbE